ncbi:MAG: T9SS type A sorting domain-containing protein [Candidatus Kerfeldbacteria bacterium]|nr:T9SS type A sorting domain-containing protein [Candidatus Kerfeldbacteria bacterium]
MQNVRVEFWDNNALFATDTIDLAGNGTDVASATWTAASPDSHAIRVMINPFVVPSEASYTNNSVTKLVVLGQPIVGVGDQPQQLRFWLGPAVPNPTTGAMTVRFTIPGRSRASFEIFDIAGRRIQSWQWEDLPAGTHQVQWDRQNVHGQTASAGIYFYRLQAGANMTTKKVVLLR